jgi:hypothetical protein
MLLRISFAKVDRYFHSVSHLSIYFTFGALLNFTSSLILRYTFIEYIKWH